MRAAAVILAIMIGVMIFVVLPALFVGLGAAIKQLQNTPDDE